MRIYYDTLNDGGLTTGAWAQTDIPTYHPDGSEQAKIVGHSIAKRNRVDFAFNPRCDTWQTDETGTLVSAEWILTFVDRTERLREVTVNLPANQPSRRSK